MYIVLVGPFTYVTETEAARDILHIAARVFTRTGRFDGLVKALRVIAGQVDNRDFTEADGLARARGLVAQADLAVPA